MKILIVCSGALNDADLYECARNLSSGRIIDLGNYPVGSFITLFDEGTFAFNKPVT